MKSTVDFGGAIGWLAGGGLGLDGIGFFAAALLSVCPSRLPIVLLTSKLPPSYIPPHLCTSPFYYTSSPSHTPHTTQYRQNG